MLRPQDLLPLQAYQRHRRHHQPRAIAYRRLRTVALGPCMRLHFEDAATLRYQIQEVLRAERSRDAGDVQREIDAYAPLLPDGSDWRASLFIELPEAEQRRSRLPQLSLAAHRIQLELPGLPPIAAHANEDVEDGHRGRPSAVHFLRFPLPAQAREALRSRTPASLACTDAHYRWRQPIPTMTLASLRCDLSETPAAGSA